MSDVKNNRRGLSNLRWHKYLIRRSSPKSTVQWTRVGKYCLRTRLSLTRIGLLPGNHLRSSFRLYTIFGMLRTCIIGSERSKTHWGRVTHICVGKLTIIGSDNGLSPGRRQAITLTSAGILLIGPLGTNFSEILIGIQTLSFNKIHLKMSSAKWRLFFSTSMC